MKLNISDKKFFVKDFCLVVIQSAQYIKQNIDSIEAIPISNNLFDVLNNKKVIIELIDKFDESDLKNTENLSLQFIAIASSLREIIDEQVVTVDERVFYFKKRKQANKYYFWK